MPTGSSVFNPDGKLKGKFQFEGFCSEGVPLACLSVLVVVRPVWKSVTISLSVTVPSKPKIPPDVSDSTTDTATASPSCRLPGFTVIVLMSVTVSEIDGVT